VQGACDELEDEGMLLEDESLLLEEVALLEEEDNKEEEDEDDPLSRELLLIEDIEELLLMETKPLEY
jgi:hypothetical protein